MDLLADILEARERRKIRIESCLATNPDSFTISLKLNIPGPQKTSLLFRSIFKVADSELRNKLEEVHIGVAACEETTSAAGDEALYILSSQLLSAVEIKLLLIKLEDNDHLGRLFDLDLWHTVEVTGQPGKRIPIQVTRSDLGIAERKCLICDSEAILCSRSRRHNPEELLEAIRLMAESETRIRNTNEGEYDWDI
ncbi:MAG TPA: citrate lyase holo-[acyl-carrier protein] synthase [Clostridiaceae bacterium]|nr:citrate lyase holo-[acyl-carrier protein] synthase [Clostridiaceae bacterium]